MSNSKNYKELKKNCSLCRSSFSIWLETMNFDREREEIIREQIYNYCPDCLVLEKNGK